MPIYEFKCTACNELFEMLLMKDEDMVELKCPKCKSENFERIMSAAAYQFGSGSSGKASVSSTNRSCSSGSCTTYDIPGPA